MDIIGGGVRLSHRMDMLDKALKPIKGLYAGDLGCSGWFGVAGGRGLRRGSRPLDGGGLA